MQVARKKRCVNKWWNRGIKYKRRWRTGEHELEASEQEHKSKHNINSKNGTGVAMPQSEQMPKDGNSPATEKIAKTELG